MPKFRLVSDATVEARDLREACMNLGAHFLALADLHFFRALEDPAFPFEIKPLNLEGTITLEPIE